MQTNKIVAQVPNYLMAIKQLSYRGWGPAYPDTEEKEYVMFDLFLEITARDTFIISCVSQDNILNDDEELKTLCEAKERAKELWGVQMHEWQAPDSTCRYD